MRLINNEIIKYYTSEIDLNKETIIFLHHAFGDHRAFETQLSYFSLKYNLVTVDLIGHGKSIGTKTKDKISDTSKHLKEIMVKEEIDKAHIIGVSIGGLLAQDFANNNPEMILSVIALGAYDISNYDKSMEKSQRKQQIGMMFKAIFSMKSFSISNAKLSTYTDIAKEKFIEMNQNFKRSSFKYMSSLGKIMNKTLSINDYPLLIMVGEHDSKLAHTLAKKWKRSNKNASLTVIDKAGHCANMDNPDIFNNIVGNFLNRI